MLLSILVVGVLLFGITFIRFFQLKFGGKKEVWVSGSLALAIIAIFILGLMSFSVN